MASWAELKGQVPEAPRSLKGGGGAGHLPAKGSGSAPVGVTEGSSGILQGLASGHCGHHLMESEHSWEQREAEQGPEQINASLGHKATRLMTGLMSAV